MKNHNGIICGHKETIAEENDACCVEFSDALGDVCVPCFEQYTIIQNNNLTGCPPSPYKGDLTDYWYVGTIEQFQEYLITAEESSIAEEE